MKHRTRVLIVEYEKNHSSLLFLSEHLENAKDFSLCGHIRSPQEPEKLLQLPGHAHDIVILNQPPSCAALRRTITLLRSSAGGEIIVVSNCAKTAFVAEAYRLGAFDYILSPFARTRLLRSLLDCNKHIQHLSALPDSLTQHEADAFLRGRKSSFRCSRKPNLSGRLFGILRLLEEENAPLSLSEIMCRIQLPRSTAWRCLLHLEEEGFIGRKQMFTGIGRPSAHFFALNSSTSTHRAPSGNNEQKKE